MSKYWDVHCLDCDEEAGLHLNHDDKTCQALIPFAASLAGLAGYDGRELNVTVPGEIGVVYPAFFKKHLSHVLAAVSDSHEISGHCNEFCADLSPSGGAQCRLLAGHEGAEHVFKKASVFVKKEGLQVDLSGWHEIRRAEAARLRALLPPREKLIRDKVPEAAAAHGEILRTRVATEDEMLGLLKRKLVEEARELLATETQSKAYDELGDVIEVVLALAKRIAGEDLYSIGLEKSRLLGGFGKRLVLQIDEVACSCCDEGQHDGEGGCVCVPGCPNS